MVSFCYKLLAQTLTVVLAGILLLCYNVLTVTVQDNQTAYTLAMESGHSDIGAVIRDNTLTRKSSKVSSGEKNKRGVS